MLIMLRQLRYVNDAQQDDDDGDDDDLRHRAMPTLSADSTQKSLNGTLELFLSSPFQQNELKFCFNFWRTLQLIKIQLRTHTNTHNSD